MAYGGVQFEDERYRLRVNRGPTPAAGMAGWLMRISRGIIRNERQASYVLLAIVAALILFAVVILSVGRRTSVYDYLPSNLHSDYRQ